MQDYPTLQRFTTEYMMDADRIRLSGEVDDDRVVVLWLTQRMLNRLAPRLTEWLEKRGVGELSAGASGMDEVLHGFAQQSAEASLTPQPPVPANSASASWRVDSVDITTGSEAVALVFKSGEGEGVSVTMSAEALRQWLGVVHAQYVKGEWPTAAWPAWMQEARQPAAKPNVSALH